MSDQNNSLIVSKSSLEMTVDREAEPIVLADVLGKMGLTGPRVPASELVDRTFNIIRARSFDSAFQDEAHAYFCVCEAIATRELFTTVLGGSAVVDVIDAMVQAGINAPLQVTLRKIMGGKFGRYYILE